MHMLSWQVCTEHHWKLRPDCTWEAHEPADVLVNGKVVARGEVVTIDHSYGVRITDLAKDS